MFLEHKSQPLKPDASAFQSPHLAVPKKKISNRGVIVQAFAQNRGSAFPISKSQQITYFTLLNQPSGNCDTVSESM